MHVAMVVHQMLGRSGEEMSVAETARALARLGVRVTILSAGPTSPDAAGCDAVGLGFGKLHRSAAWDDFERAVAAESAARGADIVHSVGVPIDCDVYEPRGGTVAETYRRYLAMPRPLSEKLRLWFKMRSRSVRLLLEREREFMARRPGPAMLAISDYVERQFREIYAIPPERIVRIRACIDLPELSATQRARWRSEVRAAMELADEHVVLLFVAHHFRQKGLGYLLDALSQLDAPPAPASASPPGKSDNRSSSSLPFGTFSGHLPQTQKVALAVMGRDDPERFVRRQRRLGLACPVHYLGGVAPADRWQYFAAADVLVHPTVYDAAPRVIFEAAWMDLPIVTTRHCGLSGDVSRAGCGWVVSNAWAIAELADALRWACDPAERSARSRSAAAWLSTARQSAEQLLAVYRRCIGNQPQRHGGTERNV